MRQLTLRTNITHSLDNNLNFSPDNKWLCYDTRPPSGIGNTRSIERVHIITGEIDTIYQAPNPVWDLGPGVGAASYFPTENKVVFIHGLDTKLGLKYEMTRRVGAIVEIGKADMVSWADARDITFPFTSGALRGGTHRHEPGGSDGSWIGYTYNDIIMAKQGKDLRTIGVTKLKMPVQVDKDERGENCDGLGFSAVVVKVTPNPQAGSDDIIKASGDSWVGRDGYRKPDGTRQIARGFIGELANGHEEVFIVDIPDDITKVGPDGPLEGTRTSFPTPPAGTKQRRLTFSEAGCTGNVRSDPGGTWLSYRTTDALGRVQIYLISPHGGEPKQATLLSQGVTGEARWHFSGKYIICAADQRLYVTNVDGSNAHFGVSRPITEEFPSAPLNVVWSSNGRYVAFNLVIEKSEQIFIVETDKEFWQE
jgi:hypothetical protein